MDQELVGVFDHFSNEDITAMSPIDEGLINRSYLVETGERGYILQRINRDVFGDAEKIMENIEMVHSHLKRNVHYHTPEILRTLAGQLLFEDQNGFSWRVMHYIPNSRTFNATEDSNIAKQAGQMIGMFHVGTKDLVADSLHTILPNFHDLNFRADLFLGSLQNAKKERLRNASTCIPQAEELIDSFSELTKLKLPLRVTHNDTKLNNILFNKESGNALCLIDLDTLMPGYIHHDFGDAVRTLCNTATEEERDLSRVGFNLALFKAFAQGYLKEMGKELVEEEWTALPYSVVFMPFIMGLRFLTDFLYGDIYYKVKYEDQNLDRCKNQFKLIDKMAEKKEDITEFILNFR